MRTCVLGTVAGLVAGLTLGGGSASGVSWHEGDLDISFGNGGIVTTPIGGVSDAGHAVALQSDGKIVAAGHSKTGSDDDFALARYQPDGTLDTDFGGDGTVTTDLGSEYETAFAVAVQPDGKIVAAGRSMTALRYDFALARYNPDGTPDTRFSGDGAVTTDLGGDDDAHAVAVQSDGKIVLAGYTYGGSGSDFALARYNPDGTPDASFGGDGKVITSIGSGNNSATAMVLQPDGKIVVAGSSDNGADSDFALARYNPDGTLDGSFDGGTVTTGIGTGNDTAQAVSTQPDGKIVAAGESRNGSDSAFALARYLPDGTPDSDFDGDGKLTTTIGGTDSSSARALALQPGGKIIAAGRWGTGAHSDFALARYHRNGSLDAGFGADGTVTTSVGSSFDYLYGVALQPDGRIVAAGYSNNATNPRFALTRYLGDTTAPFDGRMIGLPRYSTALHPTLAWLAGDDNTGVRTFQVRYRSATYRATGYGGYTTFKNATTLPYAAFPAQAGRTYCLSVRATDRAGNTGPYGAESCTEFPVNDRTLTVAGNWTKLAGAKYYLDTARRSTSRGAALTLPGARYRHLALLASTAPGAGVVKVYLGSTLLKIVDLASARTHHRVLVPIDTSVAVRTGTIKIVQAAAGKPITIDGLATSLA